VLVIETAATAHVQNSQPEAAVGGQAGIPIAANAWTTFPSSGFPAEVVGYDATVYAKAIRRHVFLGKYHHYGSEPNYCMNGWSWDENRWDILDCGGSFHDEHSMEGGHPVGAFVYMPNRASIVYWGGQSGSNQPEQAFHTWWWDVQGRTGRDKISATRPGLIKVSAMAYDELRDRAVFYPDAAFRAEIYDPVSNRWSVPEASGSPPPRGLTFPTMEWNSKDHKTYLYGGAIGNSCTTGLTFNSDIYTFDVASTQWAKLDIAPDPIHGAPPGRWHAGFAYDPDHDIFLLVGGQQCIDKNAAGLLDTWKLDPVAKRWTQLAPSANYKLRQPEAAPFQRLKYDPDHHAFVMVLTSFDNQAIREGVWGNYPARVWVFCYLGPCPNVGSQPAKEWPFLDSINRKNAGSLISAKDQTWGSDTAVTTDNGKIFGGWIETGLPFDGGCLFHHPYVQSLAKSSWAALGSTCTAMDARAASVERDAEKLSLAVTNGTLWATWSEANDFVPEVLAKYWNGSSWVGGPIGKRNPKGLQGFSQIVSAGGVPVVGFIENNRSLFPDITEAYVDRYDGVAWRPLGGKLNRHADGRVESLSIAADGKVIWACWTESTITGWTAVAPGQLYCSSWDGEKWKTQASPLNNSVGHWAQDVNVAYGNGHFYVAWTERPNAGNALLYVKSWDGSEWSLLGQALNRNTSTGWAFHPRLAADNERLYLSWEEQLELGKPTQLYVSRWDSGAWSALGTALNEDATQGKTSRSSIALLQHAPVVLWNEVRLGELQQTYGKQWNGSSWIPLPAWSRPAPAKTSIEKNNNRWQDEKDPDYSHRN